MMGSGRWERHALSIDYDYLVSGIPATLEIGLRSERVLASLLLD
jgi:hypothetical protein